MSGYGHKCPTHFFEFTTSNAINQVADAPDGVSANRVSDSFNFLVLPNGQILVGVGVISSSVLYANRISRSQLGSGDFHLAVNVYPGTTYTITGTQLNGLTQGAYYGDDFQMATNYPIVQITNSATGHVFYGSTFNVSNRSIAPGASVSTDFTVPANIELGAEQFSGHRERHSIGAGSHRHRGADDRRKFQPESVGLRTIGELYSDSNGCEPDR